MASGFVAYLLDLLVGDATADLGRPSARAMFGGYGLYLGDRMVGLIAADVLYLKTDATTRPEFEAAGSRPFEYQAPSREKPIAMSYWEAPADALEDVDALRHWLALAHAAAQRGAAAKRKSNSKPKPRAKSKPRSRPSKR